MHRSHTVPHAHVLTPVTQKLIHRQAVAHHPSEPIDDEPDAGDDDLAESYAEEEGHRLLVERRAPKAEH